MHTQLIFYRTPRCTCHVAANRYRAGKITGCSANKHSSVSWSQLAAPQPPRSLLRSSSDPICTAGQGAVPPQLALLSWHQHPCDPPTAQQPPRGLCSPWFCTGHVPTRCLGAAWGHPRVPHPPCLVLKSAKQPLCCARHPWVTFGCSRSCGGIYTSLGASSALAPQAGPVAPSPCHRPLGMRWWPRCHSCRASTSSAAQPQEQHWAHWLEMETLGSRHWDALGWQELDPLPCCRCHRDAVAVSCSSCC